MQKKVGILIYENAQPMDFSGPWEVLSFWKNVLRAPIDMYLISENGGEVHGDNNFTVKAHCDFDTAPQLDYLIVAGGRGRIEQVNNPKLIAFIQKQAAHSQYILSVCTGMFLVHKAGLLKDMQVTTYWRALPEVKKFTDVSILGKRIVKNGKVWMAGGISSGIDLAFELIAELAGKETAGKVQLLFEYFPINDTYATAEMVDELPQYNQTSNKDAFLPEYILEYLQEKK